MTIKLISYDLLNRKPQTSLTSGEVKTEIRESTAIESLLRRLEIPTPEIPTFYVAPYSKYINVDDLTNHTPEGTVLLATSSAQLYFGSPEVKAAIKTLMPLETQIPGYARGLFAAGESQLLDRPLKVLVVNDRTGANNADIPEQLIRNIVADGSSAIDRTIGEQMQLISDKGLSQVRGYSLDPEIGSYYLKGTVTPLNLQEYFATNEIDIKVDLILTTSMLKGLDRSKRPPQLGLHEVDPCDLAIVRTNTLYQTTAKLGSVQDLYATGLAKDVAIPVQSAIQDLQHKQADIISLAEDYVRTFKLSQQKDVERGKVAAELPGNIAFIDAILESKNWGLLELESVRSNLQEYINGRVKDIKAGEIDGMVGDYRPLVVCGELKHNQVAGIGLTTGDKHVALRYPVLNRGQVQAVEVNNEISIFQNPELGALIPDAIYIGRQTLEEIAATDPQMYSEIVTEYGSVEAATLDWRTNLEAMKADFDGDGVALFSERQYPNFYLEVADNLRSDKLMNFVAKDEKQLIENNDLPEIIVERLKNYVGIINENLSRINNLYSSLDFILDNKIEKQDPKKDQTLKVETLKLLYNSSHKYRDIAESLIEPDTLVSVRTPDRLQSAFKQIAPFYSVNYIRTQADNPAAQANYLHEVRNSMSFLLGAYQLKSLTATPANSKKNIVFPPDLIADLEQLKYMKLKSIREGSANVTLLDTYLDNYAKIYAKLSKIIDVSEPIYSSRQTINPDTNESMTISTQEKITPNYTYDSESIDTYLRDYQTIVLRTAIELVDRENQRAVDFVKSGVKPDEGTVYAVKDKLPDLNVGVSQLVRTIINGNHVNRLPTSSSMSLNALLGGLRSVDIDPEIKATVANFRFDYQLLQKQIVLERKALEEFKYGKPIVLRIKTEDNNTIIFKSTNISDANTFRQLNGKGSISTDDGLVTFYPDRTAESKANYQYTLGTTTASIEGKQRIASFEFEVLYDRINALKNEARDVLESFRQTIAAKGWNEKTVFAAIAQMVGEKAISQDFLLSALPERLRDFVLESGAEAIVLNTEYPQYLSESTEYFVSTGESGAKQVLAKATIDNKPQWVDAGQLTSYSMQLLDKTSFQGTIAPNYNIVTFKSPERSIPVGKLTQSGKGAIDTGKIEELQIVRKQTPSYRLKFEELDIQVVDLAPQIVERLGDEKSASLPLDRLNLYDNKFSATTTIDGNTYYLTGVNFDKFNKFDRDNAKPPIERQLKSVNVTLERQPQPEYTLDVYADLIKVGEITQPAEQKFWNDRLDELATENELLIKVASVVPKQVGYQLRIDNDTLFNSNVWAQITPAKTYLVPKGVSNAIPDKSTAKANEQLKSVIELASGKLRQVAENNSFPRAFAVDALVPTIDRDGLREVKILQLIVPNNKIDIIENYFQSKEPNVAYLKLKQGIPATYEESRRGYTVLQVDPTQLSPQMKAGISKQLGKPIAAAEYAAKLDSIPIVNRWTPIELNSLKKSLQQFPTATTIPNLNLDRARPLPPKLRPIAEEVLTRFKGRAMQIDDTIVFEFVNERQRDTAVHHLGLPIGAKLPTESGGTRYFAAVEAGALQTYINDRAVVQLSIPAGLDRPNPILSVHAAMSKDLSQLSSRNRIDVMMGFMANKYIGIPLSSKQSLTELFRTSWKENANVREYNSTDIVMISGNRTSKDTSNELLARHFRVEYLPLIEAAISGNATLVFGDDGGIDRMVKDYLLGRGYNLDLNSAGIYQATASTAEAKLTNDRGRAVVPATTAEMTLNSKNVELAAASL